MSARIITDRETGRSRGFGFVEYGSDSDAEEAIRQMNDAELDGRKLRVNAAEERPRGPRPERPSYGGNQGGGGGDGDSFARSFASPSFSKPKGSRRGLRGRKRSLG